MVPKSNQGTGSHIVMQTASSPPSRLHIFSVLEYRNASIATEVSLNFHIILLENGYFKRFSFTDKSLHTWIHFTLSIDYHSCHWTIQIRYSCTYKFKQTEARSVKRSNMLY